MNERNKDGLKHGYWEYHHNSNGRLSAKGNYINDKPDGYWEVYHRNGKLRRKQYYYI